MTNAIDPRPAPHPTRSRRAALVGALLGACAVAEALPAQAGELPIAPTIQETPVWCWVAVSEMVFRHYGVPNVNPAGDYQCGIVGSLGGSCYWDCGACVFPAGQMQNLVSVMEGYPAIVEQALGQSVPQIDVTPVYAPLSAAEVRAEIDAGRPVVAAITPNGIPNEYAPAHVALIVGYEESGGGGTTLIVNDPFPYAALGLDPYLAHGASPTAVAQYAIDYGTFTVGLAWAESVTHIGLAGSGPPEAALPAYCCTPAGPLGPYDNPGDLHEGDACWGTDGYGYVHTGYACTVPSSNTPAQLPPPALGACSYGAAPSEAFGLVGLLALGAAALVRRRQASTA